MDESDYLAALRKFFDCFEPDNDPEKIDMLLDAFSRNYLAGRNREKFEHKDSLHMLAFALIILDIEIHYNRNILLDQLTEDFLKAVKGINNGTDFGADFIADAIENILLQKIINLR